MDSLDRILAALEAATLDSASPLHFTPARLRARVDGSSPERQRRYLAAIAATGRADRAAALVGMSEQSAGHVPPPPDGPGPVARPHAPVNFRGEWQLSDLSSSTSAPPQRLLPGLAGNGMRYAFVARWLRTCP